MKLKPLYLLLMSATTALTLPGCAITAPNSTAAAWVPPAPEMVSRYRLTIDSDEGGRPRSLQAVFDVKALAGSGYSISLVSSGRVEEDGRLSNIDIAKDCLPPAGQTFNFAAREDIFAAIPACVPEPVFGAITDLFSFLQVRDAARNVASLQAAGDQGEVAGFTVNWSRPPDMLAARVTARAVKLSTQPLPNGAIGIRWEPQDMTLDMLRKSPQGGVNLLIRGREDFALGVEIDRASGKLLRGQSVRDKVSGDIFVPYLKTTLPDVGDATTGNKFPLQIQRQLKLEWVQ
ncbi:MAG: hypothetical protein JNM52_02040 [Betaproteobacteria bacterium]|nr:hypothetical protein [Betaproteobacteria bacterium]